MIRPFVCEVLRYGDYSRLGESVYDHPHQWGSKRTGPDLAREGGRNSNAWHYRHMENPRSTSIGSNMPAYPWLLEHDADTASLPSKIRVQRLLGVPMEDMSPEEIQRRYDEQAASIADELRAADIYVAPEKEVVALIAYLQKLGLSKPVEPAVAQRPASPTP